MNPTLKIILIVVAVLIIGFVILVSTRPDDFRVSRSATIAAPPDAVFPQVNNLRRWEAWSPWAKLDPNAKATYDGPEAGTGAGFAWDGNSKVGTGHMAITESRSNELIRFKLDFLKPFKATNEAEFTFRPDGNQTVVTWSMYGKCNFASKVIGLFMDCDKMVGGQFETGLADLKSIAETSAKK
ncbi:MAG TPA: SRPBCC family protein [Candidatus Paceibacterota bacterium]|nr:SRPBCC family protein [Candidatus Paceibacterota bacterium]